MIGYQAEAPPIATHVYQIEWNYKYAKKNEKKPLQIEMALFRSCEMTKNDHIE